MEEIKRNEKITSLLEKETGGTSYKVATFGYFKTF